MESSASFSAAKRALLAQRLQPAPAAPARECAIPVRSERAWAPLSFAQRQMWLLEQMAPGSAAYHLPYGFRLRGRLDLAALARSFEAIVARHEILRTTFAPGPDGEP